MPDSVGPIERAAQAAFHIVAGATLLGAWFAVSARNLFRAALGLALALFGVAALYLFLEAEFLAVVQLLVYVGAILTLILFGVMLTARIADPNVARWNRQAWVALPVAAGIALGLAALFLAAPWPGPAVLPAPASALRRVAAPPPAPASVADLGRMLLSTYLLPFELLSVLLLGALVGAITIARKE